MQHHTVAGFAAFSCPLWRVTVPSQSNHLIAQSPSIWVFVFSSLDQGSFLCVNLFPVILCLAWGQETDNGDSEIPHQLGG